MIQRVVCVKLKEPYRTPEIRSQVVAETQRVLPGAANVIDLRVAVPADARSQREWDLCILVRFDTIEDVEVYRTDRVHRAYADAFLMPMTEKIRVWNFELAEGQPPPVSP